jgi:hypothetical protein
MHIYDFTSLLIKIECFRQIISLTRVIQAVLAIGRSKTGTDPGSGASVGFIGRSVLPPLKPDAGSVFDRSVWDVCRIGFGLRLFQVGRIGPYYFKTRKISVGSLMISGYPTFNMYWDMVQSPSFIGRDFIWQCDVSIKGVQVKAFSAKMANRSTIFLLFLAFYGG